MNASTGATPGGRRDASVAGRDEEIEIRSGLVVLAARLTIPARPVGLVLFAHGSGSGRHSPRNRHVAGVLNATGLATMLLDLLTPSEEQVRASTFDVARLAERLLAATEWAGEQESLTRLPLGYFGAST